MSSIDQTRIAALEQQVAEQARIIEGQNERLATSEKQTSRQADILEAILSHLDYGVVAADGQGRFIFYNAAAETILEQRPLLSPGQATYRLFNLDGSPIDRMDTPMGRAMRGIVTRDEEFRLHTDAGADKILLVSATPLRDAGRSAISVFKDVTALRARDRALQEQQEWFRVTLASIGDAVIATDLQGQVMFLNGVAASLTGWSLADATGRPLAEVFDIVDEQTREAVENPFEKVRRLGQVVGLANHAILRGRDGTEHAIDDNGAPIQDGHGQVLGVVIVFRDITERRRLETALLQAHAELEQRVQERTGQLAQANVRLLEVDRLKSEFLATMSHELRTPLNSIIGFSSTLLEGLAGELSPEQQIQLRMVYQSGEHLLRLISEILDLSRIESGRVRLDYTRVEPGQVLREVVESLQSLAWQRGLTITVQDDCRGTAMRVDRQRLTQILLNLLGNAIKFTAQGQISARCSRVSGDILMEVQDSGIGIAPADLPRLFEPFVQLDASASRAFEGTGLGLYLCHKLISIMHGSIGVESEVGRGSRFYFSLPVGGPPS